MSTTSSARALRFDAVVIGASAGGVDVLGRILSALPATFPLPIAVVLHVAADRPSLLREVFAPKCRLAVREAEDKDSFVGGGVYFAPPDYHLLMEAPDLLALSIEPPCNFSRPSIDILFESAAYCLHKRVLGILLTGASSDGAKGLRAIAKAGGFTVVQDPEEAYAPQMPRSAIDLHAPSAVLTCSGIIALLCAIGAK